MLARSEEVFLTAVAMHGGGEGGGDGGGGGDIITATPVAITTSECATIDATALLAARQHRRSSSIDPRSRSEYQQLVLWHVTAFPHLPAQGKKSV